MRRKKKKQQCKVGREEKGSSSNRLELAAFFLALRDTLIEKPLLYLCDSQSLLKTVTRWIGKGGKATLVGSPDADFLAAAIEILRKRIAAGTATFLVKVKVHRGEPANEGADILADKGEGPSLAITTMFCSEFAHVFRLSVSMRQVAGEHPFCVLIYMNSYIFHIYFIFIYFIFIS